MSEVLEMVLHGGPHDGEAISIHRDNLKIKPRITVQDSEGRSSEYALNNEGTFVWLPNPDDPRVARGVFVFDDEGNVLSEEPSVEDALDRLDELNDEGEQWKFQK